MNNAKKNDEPQTVAQYRNLQEARDELVRELNLRSRCFPRWIQEGRVSLSDAKDRLDRMATALRYLESLDEDTPLPDRVDKPEKPF